MAKCFFKSEIAKLQTQFNEVFGDQIVFNIQARQASMFAIIHLMTLEAQINKSKSKQEVRHEIQQFVRGRNSLRKLFVKVNASNCKTYNKKLEPETPTLRVANA